MDINEKSQNDVNQEFIYSAILQPLMSANKGLLELLKDFIKELKVYYESEGIDLNIETEFPNIALTAHNKISELVNTFNKSGVSFFAKADENIDYVRDNYIGTALMKDILSKVYDAQDSLEAFNDQIELMLQGDNVALIEADKMGKVQRFLYNIKNTIIYTLNKNKRKEKIYANVEKANKLAEQYAKANKELDDYDLRENIVNALVTKIQEENIDPELVPILLDSEIKPDFEKLGIVEFIPVLQERIIEAYTKSIKNPEQVNDFNKDMYIPRFDKSQHELFAEKYKTSKERGVTGIKQNNEIMQNKEAMER